MSGVGNSGTSSLFQYFSDHPESAGRLLSKKISNDLMDLFKLVFHNKEQ